MTCQVMRDGGMDPPPKELCTLTLTRICTAPSSALKGCPAFTRHFTAEHSMGDSVFSLNTTISKVGFAIVRQSRLQVGHVFL